MEDLVITLADAIASTYLELISVDGNLSDKVNALGLAICNLSTRELQKLRNEVWILSFVSLVVAFELVNAWHLLWACYLYTVLERIVWGF